MATSPSTGSRAPRRGALAAAMVALAGMPEHAPGVDGQLRLIARLTPELVAPARYASITALRGDTYTTVAFSDELARAIDEAQYADNRGPCLDALDSGSPVAVPDIDATVQWPKFHEVAPSMGLHTSVSVPLYAGRGEPVAVLNVYSNDRVAMAPLLGRICSLHGHAGEDMDTSVLEELDEGGKELISGYAQALSVRATIKLALGIIMVENRCTADDAYVSLCLHAGQAGTDLAGAATVLITRGL
nr:GAF and ANTAR domain-containing protein [uncultured Actinoplanes sp.]